MSSKSRHNELKKKHKAYKERLKQRSKIVALSEKKFMFQEFMVNCEDAIALMVPANGRLYRLAHDPNQLKDIYPTSLWKFEPITEQRLELPTTIPPGSPIEDQQNQLRTYTPSFNTSDEGAASHFVGRLAKQKTPEQLLNFKSNKGSHIFAYDVCPEDGRMWVEPDGHVSFQPYEGFCLEKHIADGFTPIPIENYVRK